MKLLRSVKRKERVAFTVKYTCECLILSGKKILHCYRVKLQCATATAFFLKNSKEFSKAINIRHIFYPKKMIKKSSHSIPARGIKDKYVCSPSLANVNYSYKLILTHTGYLFFKSLSHLHLIFKRNKVLGAECLK